MADTAELGLRLPKPEVTPEDVLSLCRHLLDRGWVPARVLCEELGIDDRRLRALAEHSDGAILSGPGCPGYKVFTSRAEIDDADRAASSLEGQARRMLARAAGIRRRFHRYARV